MRWCLNFVLKQHISFYSKRFGDVRQFQFKRFHHNDRFNDKYFFYFYCTGSLSIYVYINYLIVLLSNLASVDVLKQALHGRQMGHRPYKDIARALEHIYRHLCTCKY